MVEIKIEDLFIKCDRCKGRGAINETKTTGANFGVTSESIFGGCPDCNGLGGKLTPSGEALREFMIIMKRPGGRVA
jgi:hypothetical protein